MDKSEHGTNRNPAVDEWFHNYGNPQRDLVASVREFILAIDPAVTEAIKWQAPTFMYKGNIASFFPKSKKNVTLMCFEAKKPALEAIIRRWMRDRG
jgi:uncharacterized protein YdhG (YjbR/CyaY superfamily)